MLVPFEFYPQRNVINARSSTQTACRILSCSTVSSRVVFVKVIWLLDLLTLMLVRDSIRAVHIGLQVKSHISSISEQGDPSGIILN